MTNEFENKIKTITEAMKGATVVLACKDERGKMINVPDSVNYSSLKSYKNGGLSKKLLGSLKVIAKIDLSDFRYDLCEAKNKIKYIYAKPRSDAYELFQEALASLYSNQGEK
jgi:hypothetical protein